MKKIATVLFFSAFIICSSANAADCQTKNSDMTCEQLNYTEIDISNGNDIVCTPCPIYKENKYSCAKKGFDTPAYSALPLSPESRGTYACDKVPHCAEIGYTISKQNVKKIPINFSCSACPFDGNWWACAGNGSLVTVEANVVPPSVCHNTGYYDTLNECLPNRNEYTDSCDNDVTINGTNCYRLISSCAPFDESQCDSTDSVDSSGPGVTCFMPCGDSNSINNTVDPWCCMNTGSGESGSNYEIHLQALAINNYYAYYHISVSEGSTPVANMQQTAANATTVYLNCNGTEKEIKPYHLLETPSNSSYYFDKNNCYATKARMGNITIERGNPSNPQNSFNSDGVDCSVNGINGQCYVILNGTTQL